MKTIDIDKLRRLQDAYEAMDQSDCTVLSWFDDDMQGCPACNWYYAAISNISLLLSQAEEYERLKSGQHALIPVNVKQAQAMISIAQSYLKAHTEE